MDARTDNAGVDAAVALSFINQWFGATEAPAYLCSLPNDKSTEPGERHVSTCDRDEIVAFITKWNRPGRGLFFCVSTIRAGTIRNKDNVCEVPGLWADIDFKDVKENEDSILKRVKTLPRPPSIIVRSGHGLHLYWRFKESLIVNVVDGAETIERVEAASKLLADLVGGDPKVTQIAALMRLPGSHNSKGRDEWTPVEIESANAGEFELDDIEDMLAIKSPIVLRKLVPSPTADEINPFLAAAKDLGFKPPIDVEKRLAAMVFMGGGESAIHETQISVSASMLNAGISIDEVVSLVMEATRAAAGDYGKRWNWKREEKELRKACATWLKKHPPGEDDDRVEYATDDDDDDGDDGGPDHDISDADERVANEAPVGKKLQVIKITTRISVVTTKTEAMLVRAKVPFYQRSGELVRPIIKTVKAAHGQLTKTAQLKPVSEVYLRDTICRHSLWQRFDARKGEWVKTMAPMNVAETLLARDGKWDFSEIVGVISTPTMRPDGTLLIKQGYDPATRLLLIEPPLMPVIPDEPTRDDALKALALLEDLVKESPFVDGVAKAVALSGIITAVVRGAFPVSPMHVSTAPVAGSGKSFLWDLPAAISAGQRRIPVIAAGDEKEIEKRMVGVLLSGQPLVSIDNVNGELKSDFLAQVIEQHILDIRPLGRSPLTRIETGALTTYATGNNIVIVGDLCRRTITSRLNAKMENPQYKQYAGDPIATILENRGVYIAACLILCRAYIVAGRPGLLPRLASFEGWSDIVRSALVWLGQADCVASMETTRAEDPQRAALSDVLTTWGKAITVGYGGRVTLAVAVEMATEMTKTGNNYGETPELIRPEFNAALRAAVALGAGAGGVLFTPKLDTVTLGRWCKSNKERIVDGVYLMNQPSAKGVATWWVERNEEAT
jgi:hypothetical protein